MTRKFSLSITVLVLMVLLAACNLPTADSNDPNAVLTITAQTVEAQLTLNAILTPPATFTPAVTDTPAPTSTNTPVPITASPTPVCDLAQFVDDVTIDDGTAFLPNTNFTKTWRLRNIGTCTWTPAYQLIFDNGELMSGPNVQPLLGTVAPGQTVDLSVNLKSPAGAGSYRGYWRLRNAAGVLIPVAGGHQGTSFFVDIKVTPPTATPTATPTQLFFIPPILIITLSP